MLHLAAGHIGSRIAATLGRVADALLPQDAGQRGIFYRDIFLLVQFFKHPLRMALALAVEAQQQFKVDVLLILPGRVRRLAVLLDDLFHRVAAYPQALGDLPCAHPVLVQQKNRLACLRIFHETSSMRR